MALRSISPKVLTAIVGQFDPSTPEVLSAGQLISVYRECLGDESALFDSWADANSFQGLIDLTRAHLRQQADELASGNERRRGPGKPRRAIPAEKWRVSLRSDLALFVDTMLFDPAREKLSYGERSALIEQLVLAWARARGFQG